VLLAAKLLFPYTADIYMWIYLWQRPSLNRGRKTKPKKRNEESKLLLPQLEVCVVRVGGICTGCEGWGGGWWMADGGCGCGWGCGWGYCAAAAARAAQQFNLRFVRNLRNARRQGAWPSTVQLSTVQYGLRAWVRVT